MGPRASTGAAAYTNILANRIGGGTYADVYKIQKKET
jgi:hypothetical protein